MANLFARASASWDAANQWNTAQDGSGSFVTPGAGDVCLANGFTVAINISPTVAEVRNDTTGGATSGGGFTLAAGQTLTANVYAGGAATACVTFSSATPNACAIVGNLTGGTINSGYGLNNASTGTVTVTGNVTGGSASTAHGARNAVAGIINITGNVTGGSGGARGLQNVSTGSVAITGNVIAHATAAAEGVLNTAAGTVTITGYAQANDYGPGSTGIAAGNGVVNSAQGVVEVGETRMGARGLGAVSGAFRYASATAATAKGRATSGLTEVTLRPIAAVVPAVTDVKSGVIYGDGGYTGTLVATSGGSKKTNMSVSMG